MQEDIYVVRCSGGTLTVTPSYVIVESGRNRETIPMASFTATRSTRNPGAWFVVLCCITIFLLPLIWLPQGSLGIDYQGRGVLSTRIMFNRFWQLAIEEAENRIRFYADVSRRVAPAYFHAPQTWQA